MTVLKEEDETYVNFLKMNSFSSSFFFFNLNKSLKMKEAEE